MGELKDLRISKKITQKEAAELIGVSLRSYKSYENDTTKEVSYKYKYMIEKLSSINPIDEDHGVIEIEVIKDKCARIFQKYGILYCYLFGSYAKSKAGPSSDIDLLISANVSGLKYYGMVEELRTELNKRVDLLDVNQLKDNLVLTEEILREGIKIYG